MAAFKDPEIMAALQDGILCHKSVFMFVYILSSKDDVIYFKTSYAIAGLVDTS